MVGHPSVILSVCPIIQQQEWRAAGLLLSAPWAEHRSIAGVGAQQQQRHHTTPSSKCRQCHVDS